MHAQARVIEKMPTGISGFDYILYGGVLKHYNILAAGTMDAGKTLLASEFLHNGIEQFQKGAVLITLEERPDDLIANARGLG